MNDDTIYRQAAISIADDYMTDEAQDIRDRIVLLPSAERQGRWKQVGDNTYRCSVCGEISCCNSPFCSECGAKMQGEQN